MRVMKVIEVQTFIFYLIVMGLCLFVLSPAWANGAKSNNLIESIRYQKLPPDTFVFTVDLPKDHGEIELSYDKREITITIANTVLADKWQYLMKISNDNLISSIQGKQKDTISQFILNTTTAVMIRRELQDNVLKIVLTPLDVKDQKNANLLFQHNEKITLDLQDITVRAALQVLADFAKFNLVTSDNVTGNISLQLKNIPWQEVLDIILIAKNLGKRKIGNTLYVAPATVIAAQEEEALAALNATQKAEPLITEFIRLNYADVQELYKVLTTQKKDVLSARGSISVDPRTNTLIIEDIQSYIDKINILVNELDIPTQQVLIEARIVEISRSVIDELGINYTGSANVNIDGKGGTVTGNVNPNYVKPTLPPIAGSSTLGLSFARLPGSISLNMELLALESEGEAKQVSNPHLVVSDNEEAYISQGQEIPYLESTSSGAASLTFKDAVLELRVTPQIAPNDYLVMTILVKKDQKTTESTAGGAPILSKREIKTRLLMKNQETIVLGGIYEKEIAHKDSKVPLLGDLPLIGWLFSSRSNRTINRELLIFLTPRIVE
ncbi:type IV pilus secretin PilQ [Thiotrichales bacterium 19S3-7]|nr:type IV pilus secretin PilQ [Thiotrichales bacterium 19S3-7]MCF6800783.1 type IV pilus secretin PilQ [Thiotrichales bacterium 19S3-11]